jgi:ATP-dependent exoDNAse (exonuclease V) alpha subunit
MLLSIFCSQPEIKAGGVLKLAPTGKARVKLGADAKTIAQFLSPLGRYEGCTGRYYTNPDGKNFNQARTVIIDEASMLTEDQLSAVIDAIIDYARVILVGDPRQLPP